MERGKDPLHAAGETGAVPALPAERERGADGMDKSRALSPECSRRIASTPWHLAGRSCLLTHQINSVRISICLNLTPDLINRLTVIRSLLALGDLELVTAASVRLESFKSEQALAAVLDALTSHRYSEADQMISSILSEGLRLTTWTDPEIVMLEAELAKVTAELADMEAEHAELGHLMARFYAEHAAALGDRIAEVLWLRLEMLRRKIVRDPSAAGKIPKAEADFRDFTSEQESIRKEAERTEWKLNEEEQQELKNLFRATSRKCHPDLVPDDRKESAAEMFRALRQAYEEGDLEKVRFIAGMAEGGFSGDSSAATAQQRKDVLKARIARVRQSMTSTAGELRILKESKAYGLMTSCPDYAAIFAEQAVLLDEEIRALRTELEKLR